MTQRLDAAVAARGLARSRTHAAQLITAGLVSVDGHPVVKASVKVGDDQQIAVAASDHYVSRAAHKLIAALDGFLSRADLVPCDGDENVGGVRAGRGGRGDLVAADADGDVAERAQGPDDLADAVAGGLLQVA